MFQINHRYQTHLPRNLFHFLWPNNSIIFNIWVKLYGILWLVAMCTVFQIQTYMFLFFLVSFLFNVPLGLIGTFYSISYHQQTHNTPIWSGNLFYTSCRFCSLPHILHNLDPHQSPSSLSSACILVCTTLSWNFHHHELVHSKYFLLCWIFDLKIFCHWVEKNVCLYLSGILHVYLMLLWWNWIDKDQQASSYHVVILYHTLFLVSFLVTFDSFK